MSLIISNAHAHTHANKGRYMFVASASASANINIPMPSPRLITMANNNISRISFDQWKCDHFEQLVEMLDGLYNALSTEACNQGYTMSTCRNIMYDQLAEYIYYHSSNASKRRQMTTLF